MKDIKIMLDPGHYASYNPSPVVKGYYESRRMWKLCGYLEAALRRYGFTVLRTREDEERDRALFDRGYSAKGCDLFISLHTDGVGGAAAEKVDRVEVIRAFDNKNDANVLAGKLGEAKRRSGLVLDDAELMEAWERGADKQYIPVKFKNGSPGADGVASLARMGLLARHIKKSLGEMAEQLRQGSIAADPYYRGQQANACVNCDYFDACHFSDGENGESCRYTPKLSAEKVWALMEEGDANG